MDKQSAAVEMALPGMTEAKIYSAMADAEAKAWESLSGYKFWMFGYHAAAWVKYNRLLPAQRPNPFSLTVKLARDVLAKAEGGR